MIREDRELLAELAWVNSDLVPFAMRMTEQRATAAEQRTFSERLIDVGKRLRQRADEAGMVVEGESDTRGTDTHSNAAGHG